MTRKSTIFALVAPAMLVITATSTYPLLFALTSSFRRWQLSKSPTPGKFIGFDNYARAFGDRFFVNSIQVTAVFTIISVGLTILIGLGMALVLQKPGRLNGFIRTLLIFPFAVSPALKGYTFRFMLNPEYGIIDQMIDAIFPASADLVWLANEFWALFWLSVTETYGWAPLMALMFIGALNAIPTDIFEAAKVEGSTNWQLFRHITLPLLSPVIIIATLLKTIFSLKMFDQVVTMTGGGPGRATQTLNHYVYHTAFVTLDMGYASALSYILIIVISILSYFYIRALYGKGGI
ncbi:MAG: sugar ABC transporter permease [Anaerolineae bacterium]|nr:sugar ABC transporter permease [Anaerolineae bacterium]